MLQVLAVLAAVLVSLLTAPAPAVAAPSAAAYLAQARAATNHERTTRGRHALANSECLARFARGQAARMARAGRIFHTEDFDAIGSTCGLRAWAENVAQASRSDTGRGVVRAWMGSRGHRANILNDV